MMRFLYGVALVVASILFGLVIGEIGLRAVHFNAPVWYRPDPHLGWALRPGVRGWFTAEGRSYVRVSSAGFRDALHELAKPRDVYRVAVLGDSYAEAMQVDFRSAFWWRLQPALEQCAPGRRVEVMNFGVSGYGTAQEDVVLESTAARYQPDLVLLEFSHGDLRDNAPAGDRAKQRPFYRLVGEELSVDDSFRGTPQYAQRSAPWRVRLRAASDRFRMVQLVHATRDALASRLPGEADAGRAPGWRGPQPGRDLTSFMPPRDPERKDAWTVTERTIARMNRFAGRHGARFALAIATHPAQVNPDPRARQSLQHALGVKDLFYVERRLQALGRREGFQVIALAPEMQAKAGAERVYLHGFDNTGLGSGHWNENGHRLAAEIIARQLCAQGFRPEAPAPKPGRAQ